MLPILRSEQAQYLTSKNFKALSESLPATIEKALDQPPLSQLVKVTSEQSVKLAIEFELIKLSTLVSVGGNLTSAQVPFIAEQLVLQYPNESLADFKLCFQRGATGCYGEIQRMDGVTIGVWIKKYLEEKYQAIEKKLMDEKDNAHVVIDTTKIASDESAQQYIATMLTSIEQMENKKPSPLTSDDIKREGKETPPRKRGSSYIPEFRKEDINIHKQYLRRTYPGITEKQVNDIIGRWYYTETSNARH